MKLKSFRVQKFRNIVDSDTVSVDQHVTCLVGKNEAGKSALLEALYLFNPAYDEQFNVNDQYPRWLVVQDRKGGDLAEHAPVRVTFLLEEDDKTVISNVLGEGVLTSDEISIARRYKGGRIWTAAHNEARVVQNLLSDLPASVKKILKGAKKTQQVRDVLSSANPSSDGTGPGEQELVKAKAALSERGLDEDDVWLVIANLLQPRLPLFFRFTQYSTLPGRIDFRDLAGKSSDEGPGRSGLQTARALLRLAGTDLGQLGNETYELRKGELEAVQIDLTNQVFEYWKQNPSLEVLIDVDKETIPANGGSKAVTRYLDVRLRDKRTGYSNNFSQRSSGFQWFFSFLAAFSEFGSKRSPVVLLDEPALTLHGRAQADFLRFINEILAPHSPVLYTTHSPFMIESDKLERVRIVEDHGPPRGAVAAQDVLAADPDSLFPLQGALGYDIAQSLFVGPHNLLVEGTSDYIFLTSMSQACSVSERAALDARWRILPAGGATNIPTFVSLLGPHLDVTVLVDSDTKGMQRVGNMIEKKLLAGHRLIMANNATGSKEADIEDLFSEGDYMKLFNKTYGTSYKIADLPPGARITKRIEQLTGNSFDHGEVAETLLRQHHQLSFTDSTLDRFAALNQAINATLGS